MKRSVVVKNTAHTALVPLGAPAYEHVCDQDVLSPLTYSCPLVRTDQELFLNKKVISMQRASQTVWISTLKNFGV